LQLTGPSGGAKQALLSASNRELAVTEQMNR
jgi:hypothetical protein